MGKFNRLAELARKAQRWEREAIEANDFERAYMFSKRWLSLFTAMYNDTINASNEFKITTL